MHLSLNAEYDLDFVENSNHALLMEKWVDRSQEVLIPSAANLAHKKRTL